MSLEDGLRWLAKKNTKATHPTELPPKYMTKVSLLVRKGGKGLLRRFIYEEETVNTFSAYLNAQKEAKAKGLEFWYKDDIVQYEVARTSKNSRT